jgi:hypothetical protein
MYFIFFEDIKGKFVYVLAHVDMAMTLESVAEEVIKVSNEIYRFVLLLAESKKQYISLVCAGQSPAYFALAIMNLKIYRPEIVEIVVLPYSKKGAAGNISKESDIYKLRLDEVGVHLRPRIIILDYILSGVGILSLKKTLENCYPDSSIGLISINQSGCTHSIPVYKQFTTSCMSFLLYRQERIVQHYTPLSFLEEKLHIGFINLETDMLASLVLEKCGK